MNYLVFVAFLLIAVGANWYWRFDVDDRPEGTPPRDWKAKAAFPKSLWHAIASYALMMTAFAMSIHVIAAVVIVFGALLLFEYTQRYVDRWDVIANGAGVVLSIAVLYLAPGVA